MLAILVFLQVFSGWLLVQQIFEGPGRPGEGVFSWLVGCGLGICSFVALGMAVDAYWAERIAAGV